MLLKKLKATNKKENDNKVNVNFSNDTNTNYSIGLQIGKILNILESINHKLDRDYKKLQQLEKRIEKLERIEYGKSNCL